MTNFSMSIILVLCFGLFLGACKSTSETTQQSNASLTSSNGWSWNGKAAYILHFEEEGAINLKLDVNSCFGQYTIEGESMKMGEGFGCTEACCDGPEANKLTNALYQVTGYSIKGNTLMLTGPSPALEFTLANQ